MTGVAGTSKNVPIGSCDHNRNSTGYDVRTTCLSCCYDTVTPAAAMTTRRRGRSAAAPDETESSADDEYDREPPCAAAAFVASASAAVLVLLAVLLAVVLSAAALWTVASMMPVADAAADVGAAARLGGSDYLHRWHQPQRPQQPYLERHMRQIRRRGVDEDAQRRKRQLLFKKSREPGVIALTFNLIGGTVSDIREAYRNVTEIVRDTINESARPATTTAAATVDGDQMMAAGNAMENDIGGSSAASTTLAPVDQREAGNMLGKLLGRNFRGLRRLFNTELRSAVKNSPGNVRDFAVELLGSIGQSLRPSRLLTRGPANGDSAASSAAASTTASVT